MMMKHIKMSTLLAIIFALTMVCIILGSIFSKTEAEKINGLSETFDVGSNDMIAYVSYDAGKPILYLHTEGKEEKALEVSEEESINDVAFSPDGTMLAYTVQTEDTATLYTMDTRSFDTKKMMEDDAIITEITYNPEKSSHIFYLKAGTFENYSPIAQAHPHEFDVYRYDTSKKNEEQITDLSAYEMRALQIDEKGENAFVTMIDDAEQDSGADFVDVGLRIYYMPLDDPSTMKKLEMPAEDIYDIVLLPNESGIIYQAVSNSAEGGTYQYELYHYDSETNEAMQMTNLKSYAGNPVLADDNETIYFIENANFAGKHAENSMHKVTIDGKDETHIPLENE